MLSKIGTGISDALYIQDQFWHQKARTQNFIHGDRNTSYIHRVASIKSFSKQILSLRDGNNTLTSPTDIASHILQLNFVISF